VEAQIRGVVVAAPSLIAERGMPAKPSDLTGWPMISIHPFFDDTIPLRGIPLRGNAGRTAKTRQAAVRDQECRSRQRSGLLFSF
jgi:hypothetical protein